MLGDTLFSQKAVMPALRVTSKKQLFQEIAAHAAQAYGLDARTVFDALLEREKLGSTSMDRGVAIPHARLADADRIMCLFARLETPVDFDSADGGMVDLVFALLAPEDSGTEHLRALAKVSRLMRDEKICEKLRQSTDAQALYALITEPTASRAA